jgi:GT2 family glycosyltransferase/glycosyltransferase involved in cell wall biosynthesis
MALGREAKGMSEDTPPSPNGGPVRTRSREKELESALAERDRRLNALHQQLAEREATIAAILGSRSWRLVQMLQRLRTRLWPKGSFRARALRDALSRTAAVGAAVRGLVWRLRRRSPWRRHGQASAHTQEPLPGGPVIHRWELRRHTAPVDIVICVHDALADVRACLESLLRTTLPPYRLVLVDDGSDAETRDYLAAFAADQAATLVRNEAARGYTVAANQGLRLTSGEFVVLLNSDTVLTRGWLDRLVACAESDPRLGMVGPLSNTASWQSVPAVLAEDGDWAANPLPAGQTVEGMAHLVAQASPGVYPRIPFLNGFCFLIRREVITAIGLLDETTFPRGYGEENDYCARARRAGFSTAVAGDAYVWHSQSRSFSHDERKRLVRESDQVILARYGGAAMSSGVEACRTDRVLEGIRARVGAAPTRADLIEAGRQRWEGKRLLFVLPIAEPGGGGHVVIQEAQAMLRMGVDVRLLNRRAARSVFQKWHPGLEIPQIYVADPGHIADACVGFDAVVATVYFSVEWMDAIADRQRPVRGYYVQDFEPAFFPPGTTDHGIARHSYTRIPGLVRFTKTEWNREAVKESVGVDCTVVGPSVDLDLFRPRPRLWKAGRDAPFRVAAMVRPTTPRRQPALTMEVLKEFMARHDHEADVIVFGCEPSEGAFRKLATDFRWRHAGALTRPGLAALLNEIDVFADFSAFQAMGLTAMEAMACGATAILPRSGGAGSFARHRENALLVDSSKPRDCVAALEALVEDRPLCQRLGRKGMLDVCRFPPEQAAFRILAALFPSGEE